MSPGHSVANANNENANNSSAQEVRGESVEAEEEYHCKGGGEATVRALDRSPGDPLVPHSPQQGKTGFALRSRGLSVGPSSAPSGEGDDESQRDGEEIRESSIGVDYGQR